MIVAGLVVLSGLMAAAAAVAIVLGLGVMRRAAVRIADAEARADRALELLDAERTARLEAANRHKAELGAFRVEVGQTIALYRGILAKVTTLIGTRLEDLEVPKGRVN